MNLEMCGLCERFIDPETGRCDLCEGTNLAPEPQAKPTLEDRVRKVIGDSGPQLPTDEYEERIDQMLEDMSCGDLLRYISMAMEEALREK